MRTLFCSPVLHVFLAAALVAGTGCDTGDEAPLTLRLAVNPWSGSAVNAAVARILLEDELGYPTALVAVDEFAQWEQLAAGELHASLEVWPSGHADDLASYIDERGMVEDGGPLGVVGQIGWYVPAYLLQDHPELQTWEGFLDPDNVALFQTPATGDRGQFLAGDPSWVQFDQQIIDNLGLDFERVFAGSEEALLERLDAAYTQREPLLLYFFRPHAAHERYDLAEVELPPYSEACYARAADGGVDCGYPPDLLVKVFWAGLRDAAPAAHALLSRMRYTTDDQTAMIAAVEFEGQTPEEAARAWLGAHEAVWRAWMPD